MKRKRKLGLLSTILAVLFVMSAPTSGQIESLAQESADLEVLERVAFESGLRSAGVRKDRAGNYYVLNSRDRIVWMYNSHMNPRGRIAGYGQSLSDLLEPMGFAVGPGGEVVIADYAANLVKIYNQAGVLEKSFSIRRPWTVGVLRTGEILVSANPYRNLIHVYDRDGILLRSFGEPVGIDDSRSRNMVYNRGKIFVDAKDNIYYLFYFLPDPTIRKYDPQGNLLLEFHPEGERITKASRFAEENLSKQREKGGHGTSSVLNAIGFDEATGDLWISCTSYVYHLASDGSLKGTYRFKRPDGSPINADDIQVEEERLIITSSLHGVFAVKKPQH